MSSYHANLSHDGHTYTKKDGLVAGLASYSVIQPERQIRQADDGNVWEVIVIGAGYAGLIAARDLVKAGEFEDVEGKHARTMSNIGQAKRPSLLRPVIELGAGPGVPR